MILHDTIIDTPEGDATMKDIADTFTLSTDLEVNSYNIKKKRIDTGKIGLTKTTSSKDYVLLKTEDETSLIITLDHKIFDADKEEWVRAQFFKPGNNVLTSDLTVAEIVETHRIRNDRADKVYTFSVPDYENYFANGILIHNDFHYVDG